MADLASVRVVVHGHVQGVFFRTFVSREAAKLGLSGYVRNLPAGGAVEVQAEGEREQLKKIIVGFIILPKFKTPAITQKTELIGKIIKLYPHHYPKATLTKYWKPLLFDALYDANIKYVKDMYETMRISAVEKQ